MKCRSTGAAVDVSPSSKERKTTMTKKRLKKERRKKPMNTNDRSRRRCLRKSK
jgi:hypothetical protein